MWTLQQMADNASAYLLSHGGDLASRDMAHVTLAGPGFIHADVVRFVLGLAPAELVSRIRAVGLRAQEVVARDGTCVAVLLAHDRRGMDAAELALTEQLERMTGTLMTPEYVPEDPDGFPPGSGAGPIPGGRPGAGPGSPSS